MKKDQGTSARGSDRPLLRAQKVRLVLAPPGSDTLWLTSFRRGGNLGKGDSKSRGLVGSQGGESSSSVELNWQGGSLFLWDRGNSTCDG